jgi:hypothetical protein
MIIFQNLHWERQNGLICEVADKDDYFLEIQMIIHLYHKLNLHYNIKHKDKKVEVCIYAFRQKQ